MNVRTYLERKAERGQSEKRFRTRCRSCQQPSFSCFCRCIKRFDPLIKFMILIHPIESRRRIATGRMSHLCLEGSELVRGEGFSASEPVLRVLNDPAYDSVILYPGRQSTDLSRMDKEERDGLFPRDRKLAVFVIDGTWTTAGKMLRRSPNLMALPRISFTPSRPSNFRVRKQPKPGCYSTIEAVHETIELLGPARGFDSASRAHDNLLFVFDHMVNQQLEIIRSIKESNRSLAYRRRTA